MKSFSSSIFSGLLKWYHLPDRMLKKALPGLFNNGIEKMRFFDSFTFNDLPSLKMASLPCDAHRLLKNCVFQHPVNDTQAAEKTVFSTAGQILMVGTAYLEP